MKRGIYLVAVVVILASIFLASCGSPKPAPVTTPTPAVPVASVELKVATFLPKTEPRMVVFQELLKLIDQKSNGAITTKYLGGPEVMNPTELGDSVRLGNIQMAVVPGAFFSGLVPAAPMISLSQLSSDEERKKGLWDKLVDVFAPSGLRPYGRFMPHNDPAYFVGVKKVKPTSINDFKGMKLGFASPVNKAWGDKLGMTFVVIPLQEGYTALERGVVDAYTGTIGDHLNYAYCEVEDYIVDHPIYGNNGYIIMSASFWNNLPQNLKSALTDAYVVWEPQSMKVQRETEAKQKQQVIDKKKAQFITLPAADAAKYVQTVSEAEWPIWESKLPDITKTLRPLMSK
jgi:TRAP-type C4-dicarboxylate transport system substrate-binding protein